MDNDQPIQNPDLSGMNGPPPVMGGTPPPQVAQQPQVDPAAVAQMQHDSRFGQMAKAILGQSNQYSVDPNSGTLINNPVPEAPGQLFRTILGAALLGGAAGGSGNPAQGFLGGLARGGAAEQQNQQQQDLLKRSQAQQDFKNQMTVNQEQREQQNTNSQEQLRKAQIAQSNAETYRTNVLTQGSDLETHTKVADIGKQHLQVYKDAGLEPIATDVSETEMNDLFKNRPGASTFDWEATGVKKDTDANGKPTWEYTYSAYDPKGTVKVTQPVIDQWKKDGLDKAYPDLFKIVGDGKELTAQQFMAIKLKDAALNNENVLRQKQADAHATAQAGVDAKNETARHDKAEEGIQAGELSLKKKQDDEKNHPLSTSSLSIVADPKNVGPDGVNHQFITAVAQQNPQRADLIQAIGVGKEIPSAYMLARKEGEALMADVHAAFPDYDVTKAPAYQKLRTSYSAGKDKDQLEAINTAFRHLGQAYKNAESPLAIVPGTQAHAIYNSDSDQLKEEVNSAYTHGVLTKEKSESLKGDLQSPIPGTRRAAIKEVFGLLSDKAEEKQRTWQRGKPSQAIADYSFISPEAQTAYTSVTGKQISPSGELNASNPQTGLPEGNGQKIDADTAKAFLQQAGGDPNKARQLAQQHKWVF